jgi:hypothetical protein
VNLKSLRVVSVVVGIVSTALVSAASDPNVGTWKFNPEKSKSAISKEGTVVIEPAGEALKVTVDLVGTDGTPLKWSFTAAYDGKDSPVTGNSPFGNTIAMTRVDDHTTKVTSKKDGKVTVEQTVVVSADGKTRTLTTKGMDVKGNPVNSMSVYDRQ